MDYGEDDVRRKSHFRKQLNDTCIGKKKGTAKEWVVPLRKELPQLPQQIVRSTTISDEKPDTVVCQERIVYSSFEELRRKLNHVDRTAAPIERLRLGSSADSSSVDSSDDEERKPEGKGRGKAGRGKGKSKKSA